MINVRCPQCRQSMLTAPRRKSSSSRKKCVYCGKTFLITKNIVITHK